MRKSFASENQQSYRRKCPRCGQFHVKKDGFTRRKQRYRCCDCGHVFQHASRKNLKAGSELWKDYALHKQTYIELATTHHCSKRTIQRRLDSHYNKHTTSLHTSFIQPPPTPNTSIILLMDTTYFGHDFGIIVFRSAHDKTTLCTVVVHHETIDQYKETVHQIQDAGWRVEAIVSDGKRGLLG